MEFSAQQIAEYLKGKVEGNPEEKVSGFSKIENGKPGTLTFLANPKYTEYIYTTKASVVLINDDFEATSKIESTLIRVKNSYSALAQLLELADSVMNQPKKGIDSLAAIAKSAKIGENCYVGPLAVIGENVTIGNNVQIFPHAYIGDNVSIDDGTTINANVSVYKNCVIGKRVIIHSGTVIGSDGFGFAPDENGVYHKIPQLGNVVIEDDVEIGSNTCIDRSSMDGSTVLHKGVKLDNLIQIAHNVTVGDNTVMAAQVGIAGSTSIGKSCMMGGQVGIVGHLTIGDYCQFASRSAVQHKLDGNMAYEGAPAIQATKYKRDLVCFHKLPEIYKQVLTLEKEVEELKKKLENK